MIDTLTISTLAINAHIGVHAWEQRILQKLLLDISIPTSVVDCQDILANTLDYDQICQRVTAFVESKPFALIETVAEEVAQLIKNTFLVAQLTITVSKPHAIKNAGNISITIKR